jgi:hemerythrin superfamily protein
MSGSAKATIDHDEIRRWVEERGGHPARVKRRTRGAHDAGILRVDFPGSSGGRSLEPIGWDEFFETFDKSGLAFLHQDETADGKVSRFNKLVSREHVDVGAPRSESRAAKTQARGRARGREGERAIEPPDAVEMLKEQHRIATRIIDALIEAEGRDRGEVSLDALLEVLASHMEMEERIFYPTLKEASDDERLLDAAEEHLSVKRLLADLIDGEQGDPTYVAKLRVLREQVARHVSMEERELFPQAERRFDEEVRQALAQEMIGVMVELLERGDIEDRVSGQTGGAAEI